MDYHPDPRTYTIDELVSFGFVTRLMAREYKPEFGIPIDWVNKNGYNALTGFDANGWAKNFITAKHNKIDKIDPLRSLLHLAMRELRGNVDPNVLRHALEEEYNKLAPPWFEHG